MSFARVKWVSDDELEALEATSQSPGQAPPSPDYVPGPEHLPSTDYVYSHEEPKQAPLSLDYEDLADYPADKGDDDDESSRDDADDEDGEEASEEEDDDEEEESGQLFSATEALIAAVAATLPSSPPSSPLTLLISTSPDSLTNTTYTISTITSTINTTHTSPLYADAPLGYRAAKIKVSREGYLEDVAKSNLVETSFFGALVAILMALLSRESLAAAAARQPGLDVATVDATLGSLMSIEVGYRIKDVWDDMVGDMEERAPTIVEGLSQRVIDLSTTLAQDTHEIYSEARHARQAWSQSMDCSRAVHAELLAYLAEVRALRKQVSLLQRQRISDEDGLTRHIQHDHDRFIELVCTAKDPEPARDPEPKDGPADVENEAHRSSGNDDDSHESGNRRRTERVSRECSYGDFLKCQPLNFKGTEGFIGPTQWFKKIKFVFHISNCIKTLKKMMTDKYYPRGEIKKLEIKPWNLNVKDAIEFASKLMDQKIRTFADHQAENKIKLDDNSRNNQNEQPPFKKQNVVKAYIDGPGEKKPYGGSKPVCLKCNYHHNGQCAPKCNNCKKAGHLARDCRSPAAAANNHKDSRANQRGNQAGNGGAKARAYVVGTAGTNPNANVITEIGSFDVIIGMDWLSKYHVIIDCAEKIVRIVFGNEILIVQDNGSNNGHESRLNIISCTKTQKYLLKGCHVFLARVTAKKGEDKSEEKRLKDVPVVRAFTKVFPENLSGIPPTRQVKFHIDLIPSAALVAQTPYQLAASVMKELLDQPQELSDKGFIRPNTSP
uniref:Reverse transcriptase domain-containing protein n=1 Tax=Tanacetum cinerariifolium TaxID=118510 RepID=A0A6L2JTA3_TANCI|nr:reverse transcriptase domain-containing protein [Tanacetum cinerariifolium]